MKVKVVPITSPPTPENWTESRWLILGIISLSLVALVGGLLVGGPANYLFGQLCIAISFYLSLRLLGDRPLLNPVQMGAFLFYWWFSVGPSVISFHTFLARAPEAALEVQESCQAGLWVVVIGLPLYALSGRWVLSWIDRRRIAFDFMRPSGFCYRPGSIQLLWFIGFAAMVAVQVLDWLGFKGIEQTDYLSGTRTNIWWMGCIAGIGGLVPFANCSFIHLWVNRRSELTPRSALVGASVITITLAMAVVSGWKAHILYMVAYYIAIQGSKKQTFPWISLFSLAFVYLFIVEPFVSESRSAAESEIISSREDRISLMLDHLKDPLNQGFASWRDVNVESPFRGVWFIGGELARRNGFTRGEWGGESLVWGVEALIPRVLHPKKPDLNVGNLISRTVAADLGIFRREDTVTNAAISIPFEMIGNFGLIVGILSFGFVGAMWSCVCGVLFSAERSNNHPLAAWFVVGTMSLEAPFGHFLAFLRDLIIPFLCIFAIVMITKRKL